jgi:hypothetical protein
MIFDTLTGTELSVGFWAFLKSIDHAMARALDAGRSPKKLTDLDVDRLKSLADFLRQGLAAESTETGFPSEESFRESSRKADYSSGVNLRQVAASNKEFDAWLEKSKLGFEKKTTKLIEAVDNYLSELSENLFSPKETPQDEFIILRSIIGDLLLDAEVAMQYI